MNITNASMKASTLDQEHVNSLHLSVFSGLILIYSVISLGVFIRAPRIATNIRCLCCNIVFYNICLLLAIALYNLKMDSARWVFIRIAQQSVISQILATTVFSVERLIAINYPYNYRKYVKTLYVKVYILLQMILYAVTFCFILSTGEKPIQIKFVCWSRTSLHIILTIACLFCSLRALVIFRKTLLTVQVVSKDFQHRIKQVNRGKAILSICCLLSVLLHVPVAAENMINNCKMVPLQQFYTIYVLIFNTAIDPLIYMWKFRECRLQGLIYLSRLPFFNSMQEGIEIQRISIFNIPVSEARARVNDTTSTRL